MALLVLNHSASWKKMQTLLSSWLTTESFWPHGRWGPLTSSLIGVLGHWLQRLLQDFLVRVPVNNTLNLFSFLPHWNDWGWGGRGAIRCNYPCFLKIFYLSFTCVCFSVHNPIFHHFFFVSLILSLLFSHCWNVNIPKDLLLSASIILALLKCFSKCIYFYTVDNCFCLDDLKSVFPPLFCLMGCRFFFFFFKHPAALWTFQEYSISVIMWFRKTRNAFFCS